MIKIYTCVIKNAYIDIIFFYIKENYLRFNGKFTHYS